MKKLLFLFLTVHNLCYAQNYECFQGSTKQYFTNSYGYLRGIRIDSMKVSGTDVFYYPYHTPRGRYYASTTSTLDSTGGSWLGKVVIQKNNGTFLFDNLWGDTVVINSRANVGDSWIFYNDATPDYYMAKVLSADTMTVLGVLDSVKKIGIIAYSAAGIDPSDSFSNAQLILSKSHGFVQIFDLYTFPYHAPDSAYTQGLDYYLDAVVSNGSTYLPAKSSSIFFLKKFQDPSMMQLYDWNPGDIFEYKVYAPVKTFPMSDPVGSLYPYQYYLDSIVTKVSYPDSVRYACSGWLSTQQYDMFSWYYSYTAYPYNRQLRYRTQLFGNSLLIDTALMPEEFAQPVLQYYFPDDTTLCTNSAAYRFVENELDGSVWRDFFETSPAQTTYKIGYGLVRSFYYNAGNDAEYSTTLIYAVKSGVSCGGYIAPAVTVVSSPYIAGRAYHIYPNPVTTSLVVSSTQKITAIAIYDIIGNCIFEGLYSATQVPIDVSYLPGGIYLLKINDTEVQKFVKR